MGLLFESLYMDFISIVVGLVGFAYWYINSNFNYWEKRGIYYLKPKPIFGNMTKLLTFRTSFGEQVEELYYELEDHKFGGIFQMNSPMLLVKDPELIRSIMVKDFKHFQDRGINNNAKLNPLSQHLFAIGGHKWRVLRTKLSPTFTSGKMKMMFQLMDECSVQLKEYLSKPACKGEIMELKEVLAKFTTDIIGSCAFGLQFNSMTNPNSEFRKMGKKIFMPTIKSTIRRTISQVFPNLFRMLKMPFLDQDITDFFISAVKDTVEHREKNNVVRNDFLQLLIQLKNKGRLEDDHDRGKDDLLPETEMEKDDDPDSFELTDELMAAQCFVFFLAGFETSSTTMSFCLHELAVNPDVQNRLREEIDNVLQQYNGQITYDGIQKMEYLDKVISETLRKYPPVPNLVRRCTLNYNIPDTNVTLEKGTRVVIPVFALQRDPKHYPDPERFDPERFTEENKAKRHHYTYLPFGEGPRICIGMRFGLLQTKIGLATLLTSYKFSVCQGTDVPPRLDPKALVTASVSGAWLKVTCRT